MDFVDVLLPLLLLLVLLIPSSTSTSITSFPIPSSCPTKCGSIDVTYPFGIGKRCSRPGLNLICDNTTDPRKLFLVDGTTEIKSIDVETGRVFVYIPVVTMSVSQQSYYTTLIDLKNWPYFLSSGDHNALFVVGCNAVAADLVDITTNRTIQACLTMCFNGSEQFYGSWGDGYCTIDITSVNNPRSFGIRLTRFSLDKLRLLNSSGINVFITSTGFTNQQDYDPKAINGSSKLPSILVWYINDQPSCEAAKTNPSSYACRSSHSFCFDTGGDYLGYTCRCDLNYEGNPYVPNGCQGPSITLVPKETCTRTCGSTHIPFPFGLFGEEGCYRHESFIVLLAHPPATPCALYLDSFGSFVENIWLEEGQLEVETNIFSWEIGKDTPFFGGQERRNIYSWVMDIQPCYDAKKDVTRYACVSKNSMCVDRNVTLTLGRQYLGYRCKCVHGYQGNPYIHNGCIDINECNFPEKYACYGVCTNTPGNYNCTCEPGTNGDPTHGPCIPQEKNQTLLLGVIIGISIGIGMLFLIIGFALFSRRWKKTKQKNTRERYFKQNHGLLLQLISSDEDVAERTRIFSLEELEKATNKFDETRILGSGGHGAVYKGILSDQRIAAIKKSKLTKKSEINQFINEIAILSQVNHRNIVKLFGCCLETEVPLLVYEFITNRTLSEHLHITNGNSSLSWEARLRIATEAAGAVAYLHSAAAISIFHRDIKSSNILLDDQFTAKVSDFGASRSIPLDQTHVKTAIQGTFGYLDPEYYQTGQLTDKSDVYSFGVILVELLTGKKPISYTTHEEVLNLSMQFLRAMREHCLTELLEERVTKEGTEEELVEVIRLAEMCLRLKGIDRPTMKEVEFKLQGLRTRKQKKEQYPAENSEETKYLLSDPSYAFSELLNQVSQDKSRNYSMQKEFMSSLIYQPR